MRILALMVVGWMAAIPAGAVEYRTATCDDANFSEDGWADIRKQEPLLDKTLEEIARASGVVDTTTGTGSVSVPMTNCRVKWPVDSQGRSLDGYRTVVMDKVWYDDGRKAHGGMWFVYHMSRRQENGSTVIRRDVKGLSVCRSPDVCDAMGIPFAVAPSTPSEVLREAIRKEVATRGPLN